MQGLLEIAQVLKSNGTDGELILGFRGIAPDDIDIEEPVFICFDGLPVPFYIESFTRKGQGKAVVRLTGIRSYDDAEEVVGQMVYADAGDTGYAADEDFSMLKGWTLLDSDGTVAGKVTGYLDIPGNPCLEIRTSSDDPKDVIVPLHEDLILSVDEKRQELTMSIPAGLV